MLSWQNGRLNLLSECLQHQESEEDMSKELEQLIEQARRQKMTPEQREEQRRSFAYGNTKIENDRITRRMIDEAAERLVKSNDD